MTTTTTAAQTTAARKPRTINEALTLANIAKRAETLLHEDGYTFRQSPEYPTVYLILKPGDEWSSYAVDAQANFCTCPAFEHFGVCKHLLAVKDALAADEALCAEYEARGGAEYDEWCRAEYGCAA